MAQLVLKTAAGAAARLAGAYAIGAAERAIAGADARSELDAVRISTASEGRSLPIVYGRMRVAGRVIWASRFSQSEERGSKGPFSPQQSEHAVSFALALCEGPILGVGEIWADGAPLDLSRLNWRMHAGAAGQAPDPLIDLLEGGSAPAYRDTAYIVFEDFPVTPYGDRIPNLSVEVISATGQSERAMEALVRGVCLIPGSGEHIYATTPVSRLAAPGEETWLNVHQSRARSDLEASLDALEARLPECRTVSLVVSWFGDDLRCGRCAVRPGVETRDAVTHPVSWRAGGADRGDAHLVSRVDGRPAFGGTPSDDSVVEAIAALKARGYAVTYYPFILMDVPSDNTLPDPDGSGTQPAFPWRGRIRPDAQADAAEEIAAFFGQARADEFSIANGSVSYSGPEEWRFRRFILHQAALAEAAGGVDSFLIGSEMAALTRARRGDDYPAVGHLVDLARETRKILRPQTAVSYAADWSEFHGDQPADRPGDKRFQLDPLWADPAISFVGIDWYAPLSDWRDGSAHLDAQDGTQSLYAAGYMEAHVEGGEGHDWFYASEEDRAGQRRTPITDPLEPWIWRYKDIRNWWGSAHHERIGGVRAAHSTSWAPGMKPIRFTEYGCPAVDKGSNQPNVFIDPKSSESFAPHFSNGARDDLVQRRWIQALLGYWSEPGRNPVSPVYGGPMLDLDASCAWAWDARPFPEFPALSKVWTDGANWRLGHWLTGRAGQSDLAALAADLARRAGLPDADVSRLDGVVAGFAVDGPAPAIEAVSALGALYGFTIADRADGVAFLPERAMDPVETLSVSGLAGPAAPRFARESQTTAPASALVRFVDASRDFAPAEVAVRDPSRAGAQSETLSAPILADAEQAAAWGRAFLARASDADAALDLALPPSRIGLEAGDGIRLDGSLSARTWRLTEQAGADGAERRVSLTAATGSSATVARGPDPAAPARVATPPARAVLHVVTRRSDVDSVTAVAFAEPWATPRSLLAGPDAQTAAERARIDRAGVVGTLAEALAPGAEGRWDEAAALLVRLSAGALRSRSTLAVLNGAGRLAVESPGAWEIMAYRDAELTADGLWRVSGLLRGLGGAPARAPAPEGAAVVSLDGPAVPLPVAVHERGAPLFVGVTPQGHDLDHPAAMSRSLVVNPPGLRPLSPVHGAARIESGALSASWIRRTRTGGDDWSLLDVPLGEQTERYRIRVFGDGVELVRIETPEPRLMLDAETIAGLARAPDLLEIVQLSAEAGEGDPLQVAVLG